MLYLLVFLIGALGGTLSGMLGIGGGIVLFPALLYLPPLLGLEAIDVKSITGLTMIQGFFASLSAWIFYRSRGLTSRWLVVWLGVPLAVMSLTGALFSARVDDLVLMVVFAVLAIIAGIMIMRPPYDNHESMEGDSVRTDRALALAIGALLGGFLGFVGQGGAFIVMPLMLVVFRAPFRIAAGSMLFIGLMTTTAGFAGKAGVGQVPYALAGAMLLGAVPMAWAGGFLSTRLHTLVLRRILSMIVILTGLRICADVYQRFFG